MPKVPSTEEQVIWVDAKDYVPVPSLYLPDFLSDPRDALLADIRLCRPKARRLLLVEVKCQAIVSTGDYNPVDQLLSYVKAARRTLPREGFRNWVIEPLLVAEEFAPDVLEQAAKAGVACRRVDDERLVLIGSARR